MTSNLATLARESERDGVRGLIVATLVLIGALVVAAGSIWITVGWIIGPLDKMSKAMVAVAAGDETVTVPFSRSAAPATANRPSAAWHGCLKNRDGGMPASEGMAEVIFATAEVRF